MLQTFAMLTQLSLNIFDASTCPLCHTAASYFESNLPVVRGHPSAQNSIVAEQTMVKQLQV